MIKTKNFASSKYDRRGYASPIPGLHDGLEFNYKPMAGNVVEDLINRVNIQVLQGRPWVRAMNEAVIPQISGWSEVDENDVMIPVSIEAFEEMNRELCMYVRKIVLGQAPTELPPDCTSKDLKEYMLVKDAATKKISAGDAILAAQAKN